MNTTIKTIGAAVVLAVSMGASAYTSWDNSPSNWVNSPSNWENSSSNWDNSPSNWENSKSNSNRKNGVYNSDGSSAGYISNGNYFSDTGTRLGYGY